MGTFGNFDFLKVRDRNPLDILISWRVRTGAKPPVINGLTPGTNYAFQVRAFGKLGWTDWSDTVMQICA